ncbi:MAG: spore coat U domain-containing protein [Candidatus Methylomirabilales bacterium]
MRFRALSRLALSVVLLSVAFAAWPLPAAADGSCTLDTTTIDFGLYDPLRASAIQAVGYLTYTCTDNARNVRITLSAGNSGDTARRTLLRQGNGISLSYLLTLDPTRTQIWGDGYGATAVYTQASAPANTPIRAPIYASIPSKQITAIGVFLDTITVHLSSQ